MDNEIAATRILLVEGIGILALVLALMAPLGLSLVTMGCGRFRNRFANLGASVLLFPFVFVVSYLFGWMFSFAFASGPGFTGGFQSAWHAAPWGDRLGPGFHQTESGAFSTDTQDFIRFVLLGWLACVILAGAVLERIKIGGLLLLATLLSGFCGSLAVGWGWSERGWMVALMGYHDPVGATTIATLAGGFALGVLRILGPRIASVDDSGQTHGIGPNSAGLVLAGHTLFLLGLIGMILASVELAAPVQLGEVTQYVAATVYGAPTDPAGQVLNLIAAVMGGLMIGSILTHADITRTMTLTIASVIGTLPASDFFNPLQTVLLAMFFAWVCGNARDWLERKFNLDDVTGSVALFGFSGFWGLVISGILLWGIPVSTVPAYVHINPFGNTTAAMILFWVLGFIPGNIAARILRYAGGLRIDRTLELVGHDLEVLRDVEDTTSAAYMREDRYVREEFQERP
ncbi:hypothetical protein [Roseobacter weihaiensis]|uniref:hypothetical protein n=1 Tax=Roseobacter weihaiensis TaxID=2763262 RepID=UPI001D0AC9C6|nr:hypothetical protein [Roseobacter sp. H9]